MTDLPPLPPLRPEQRELMRSKINEDIDRSLGRRRPSVARRLLVVGAAAMAAVLLTGAVWVVLAPLLVRERKAWCYEASNTDARFIESQYGFDDEIDDPAEFAESNCAVLWTACLLKAPGVEEGTAPALEVCTLANDGTMRVFPRLGDLPADNESFCGTLHLAPAPAAP